MLKKTTGTAVLAAALTLALAVSAFALNYAGSGGGSGNKAFGFFGYEYVNSNQIKLFFNKQMAVPPKIDIRQFSYKVHGAGTPVAFSNMSTASGDGYSGCSDTNLSKGTTVYLTTSSGFSASTLYDLTITASTLADNNGITLANYSNKEDFTFAFKTPDGYGNYSGTPMVTFYPEDNKTDVAREINILLVMDRPVPNPSTFNSSLSAGFNYYDTHADVLQDPTIDSSYTTPASVCYTPHYNTAATAFFFPMTGNGNSTKAYNLPESTHFELIIPGFTNGGTYNGETIDFTTMSGDIATWTDAVPYSDETYDGEIVAKWVNSTITPTPTHFNVYYLRTDEADAYEYAQPTAWHSVASCSNMTSLTTPYQCDITGLTTGKSYWIRVEPVLSDGSLPAGFSQASAPIEATEY